MQYHLWVDAKIIFRYQKLFLDIPKLLWDYTRSYNITDGWMLTSSSKIQKCFLIFLKLIKLSQEKKWLNFYTLMLSGPAWPYWRKSGVNRVFKTTISGRFAKRLSYVQSSHRCSHLGIALNLSGLSKMGSFLIIVVKLYSYKESDVRNLRTIKYFRDYSRLFGCSCNCRLSAQWIPYVDLVHNESRIRTMFLQTKMVVGSKRHYISLPHCNRPFTKVGIRSPFIFRSYGSWLLL